MVVLLCKSREYVIFSNKIYSYTAEVLDELNKATNLLCFLRPDSLNHFNRTHMMVNKGTCLLVLLHAWYPQPANVLIFHL